MGWMVPSSKQHPLLSTWGHGPCTNDNVQQHQLFATSVCTWGKHQFACNLSGASHPEWNLRRSHLESNSNAMMMRRPLSTEAMSETMPGSRKPVGRVPAACAHPAAPVLGNCFHWKMSSFEKCKQVPTHVPAVRKV